MYYDFIETTALLINGNIIRIFLKIPLKYVDRSFTLYEVLPIPTPPPKSEENFLYQSKDGIPCHFNKCAAFHPNDTKRSRRVQRRNHEDLKRPKCRESPKLRIRNLRDSFLQGSDAAHQQMRHPDHLHWDIHMGRDSRDTGMVVRPSKRRESHHYLPRTRRTSGT